VPFLFSRKDDAMNVFEAVKPNITTWQVAEMYDIKVNRHGMAVCPFHNDKNPSMKVDKCFHCFACQADGDAVDFVSRLFGLPCKETAMKLADDFGISYDSRHKPTVDRKSENLLPSRFIKKRKHTPTEC
jgi:DNA primase